MKRRKAKVSVILLSAILAFTMSFSTVSAAENQITLTPSQDGGYIAQLVDQIGGEDGLYKQGVNGFDMYNNLGYVFMGWRTTGGTWQNQVIGGYIMDKLAEAGYTTTDANVEAPYGTKPDSDKSSATDDDYAWEIQYQNSDTKNLGNTWDPEYASLDVALVKGDGTPVNDAEVNELTEAVSGDIWGFNPTKEVYQKNFAKTFGMDYEKDIASLATTSEKVLAMRDVLMKSDVAFDERTSVDDYEYIAREEIGKPNLEAILNLRCRLATNSSFTDPTGTDPAEAKGRDGEFIYVGTVNTRNNTNSQNIPAEEIAGKIILTDSSVSNGFTYARTNGGVGVASKYAVESYLCPKDEEGNILQPWYESSRYSGGGSLANTLAMTEAGTPIVEWQFSNRQYDSLKALLKKAETINAAAESDADKVKVTGHQISIGQVYPMTKTEGKPGKGQAVAIAEVKGSVHPEKRVMICAHVQEPGCCDNATGVAALLGLATEYKKLVDAGKVPRPKCTITFMWGDEMNMATYWMDGHTEEKANMIASLDMDMTGEDPAKTGGVMRIEKTPDPSALYGYTLDAVPWNEPDDEIPSPLHPYYDENYDSSWGEGFVRLPDSHTLWGAGSVGNLFKRGWYLNDLYMYTTSTVIDRHDKDFEVDVCPYEGGSDHSRFLAQQIPSVLTWHFTDYVYHTSSDTLYMASPRELESVGVTTLACAQAISDACDNNDASIEMLGAVKEAAMKRMDAEKINTDHHMIYANAGKQTHSEALADEKEVLQAWGDWYDEALDSVLTLTDNPSDELKAAVAAAKSDVAAKVAENIKYAKELFAVDVMDESAERIAAAEKALEEAKAELAEAKAAQGTTAAELAELKAAVEGAKADLEKEKAKEDIAAAAKVDAKTYPAAEAKAVADALAAYNTLAADPNAKAADIAAAAAAVKDAVAKATEAKAKADAAKVAAAKKLTVKGLKVKVGKKQAVVSFKKTNGAAAYQVQYRLGKGKWKNAAKSTKKVKVTVKKLKKGKKYGFRVRTISKVNGKTIYGKWTKVKTVKIK